MDNFTLPANNELMVDRGNKQYVFLKTELAKSIFRILTQLDAVKIHILERNGQLGGIPSDVAKNLLNEIESCSNIFLKSIRKLCKENNIKLKFDLINKKNIKFYIKNTTYLQKENKNQQTAYLLNFSTKNILQVLTQLDYFLDFTYRNNSTNTEISNKLHDEIKKTANILSHSMHDLCKEIEFNYYPPKGYKN